MRIGEFDMCRLLVGLWQLSGAHGFRPSLTAVLPQMKAHAEFGYTTFDLADHYGPAEDFVGKFREQLGPVESKKLQFFTKWVPRCGEMTRQVTVIWCFH
jgi:diketogulonate reductase-like aldo/keto reductase